MTGASWMQAAANAAAEHEPCVSVAPEIVPGRVLHIDGDMIAYWAGGNDDTTIETSRNVAANKIDTMREYAGAERVIVHLTAASSTKGDRFLISTVKPYQGQRKSGRKPKNWAYLREWLETYAGPAFRVKNWATREADDGLSFFAYYEGAECVMSTKDKDMRMLPGLHLDWDTMALTFVPRGAYSVVAGGLQYGHKWFWLQMLHGDTADNIPGLPHYVDEDGKKKLCGPKTAENFLKDTENNGEAFAIVRNLYESFYADDWADRLLEQALLLWLRNDRDADMGNVFHVLPPHPKLEAALVAVRKRVKEKYDEAHRLTGQSPARQDAL